MQQAPEGVSRQHQRGITDTPLTQEGEQALMSKIV